ncbi:MAG: helix-turn-helix transcriptional regulator [Pseudomonadota bacterium]
MAMDLKQEVGSRVKAARKMRGMTQATLAEAIGMSFETVSNLERGKTAPNFNTLSDIASALSIEMKFFFDFQPNNSSKLRSRLLSELNATTLEVDDEKLALIADLAKVVAQR